MGKVSIYHCSFVFIQGYSHVAYFQTCLAVFFPLFSCFCIIAGALHVHICAVVEKICPFYGKVMETWYFFLSLLFPFVILTLPSPTWSCFWCISPQCLCTHNWNGCCDNTDIVFSFHCSSNLFPKSSF